MVAITGASGHVGTNVCKMLHEQGYETRALVHNNDNLPQCAAINAIKGDILRPETLDKLVEGCDAVIHLAAKISITDTEDKEVFKINIDGTKNIIDACLRNKVRRLVFFSSIHAFNPHPLEVSLDENRKLFLNSPMPYERSKAMAEKMVNKAGKNGLDAVILNPSAIMGPNDNAPGFLGDAFIKICKNRIPGLVPGGYNWVDVRDVAQAAINAIDKGRKGENYIIAGEWASLKDLSGLISKVSGQKTTSTIFPFWLAKLGVPIYNVYSYFTKKQPPYTLNSLKILKENPKLIETAKAEKELGIKARPLEETIADTCKWFKENGYL